MGGNNMQTVFGQLLCVLVISGIIASPSPIHIASTENPETDLNCSHPCILNVIPLKYEINLDPIKTASEEDDGVKNSKPVDDSNDKDKNSFTFPAWVKIKLEIANTDCDSNYTHIIRLNTRHCKVDLANVNITKLGNESQTPLKILNQTLGQDIDDTSTQHSIHLEENTLTSGDIVELYIPYELDLNQNYHEETWQGLYYYDDRGIKNKSDSVQVYTFHPMHVQFMFPAFDHFDPRHKKPTVKLSAARSQLDGFVSMSNMDVVETTPIPGKDGWVRDHFRETPPMQLDQVTLMILRGFQNHTVYYSVGNVTNTVTSSSPSRGVSVWTFEQENKKTNNNSAVRTVHEIPYLLEYFEIQFNGTNYPLSKLDLVAVPWSMGGIQKHSNLGIVAADPGSMLLVGSNADAKKIEKNLRVHEFLRNQIASQWFRGMISSGLSPDIAEDQDIWITREGLTKYVADWPVADTSVQNESPNKKYYNNIGKNMLEMLESVFSRKVMRSAISDFYLPRAVWKGVLPENLYDAIQQAIEHQNGTNLLPGNNVTIREMFNTVTTNKFHYPVITISGVTNDSSSISLHQKKKDSTKDAGINKLWWLPVKIMTEEGQHIVWLSPNNTSTNSSVTFSWRTNPSFDTTKNWLLANPDSRGYYRVQYSDMLLQNIITQLDMDHTVYPEDGRNYLLHNQFILSKNYDDWNKLRNALELTKYLGNETNLNVWNVFLEQIEPLHSNFVDPPNSFKKYFASKMNVVLKRIGMTTATYESATDKLIRLKFKKLCGSYEIPVCVDYASQLMAKWINGAKGNPFEGKDLSEARQYLYCAAIRSPSEDSNNHTAFHFLFDQLVNLNVADDEFHARQIYGALTCAKDDTLLVALLNDSKLATGYTQFIQKEEIPHVILQNRPVTMTQKVLDFWMKETLDGDRTPASFMRHLWIFVQGGYVPSGSVESILKFFNEHTQLFTDELSQDVEEFKHAVASQPEHYNEFWKDNGIGSNVTMWLKANS